MKRYLVAMGLSVFLVGCGDLDDCPGADVCSRDDNAFSNSRCACSCTDSQRTDEAHMCCESGPACDEENSEPDSDSGMTPRGNPVLSIEGLQAFASTDGDVFIAACESFLVQFAYRNRMNGVTLDPEDYMAPVPMLVFTEASPGTTEVPDPREVPWASGLASGALDPKVETYDGGIEPVTPSQIPTYAVDVFPLPTTVSGVKGISVIIGQFENTCT